MAIIDKPSDYFNTKIYTGNGTTDTSITGVGFQPDMSWFKGRTNTENHFLFDSIRGATVRLIPNGTSSDLTAAQSMKSFDSDGFTLGSDADVNQNSINFASWNWKAGTSFTNDASATGIGTIDSTGSVNTTSGFSIISWTGDGNNGATIAHGLGVTPAIVITKRRNTTGDWQIGGSLIDTVRGGANSLLLLNTTVAMDNNAEVYQTFNSTTFQVGVNASINASGGTLISYCFRDVQGYSKFGSYTGNGSTDGTFVYTGFKPAFLMTKRTDTTSEWVIFDNKRDSFNQVQKFLQPDSNSAEGNDNGTSSGKQIDFLSNGWKMRGTTAGMNASGGTYIYMAFAENPLVTSTAIPACAR